MKLDDRPVIDQLLEPTPLNHLAEARELATRLLDEREAEVSRSFLEVLREAIKELDLDLSADTLDRIDSTMESVGDEMAQTWAEAQHEGLGLLSDLLEARL